jgi:hypothetical protein
MLSALVQQPGSCPATGGHASTPAGASGVLLFHQTVARQASARALGSRVFITASPGAGGSVGEIVLVDDRPNVWSAMSVLCTLDALARPSEWSVAVFCGSERARDFFASVLLPHIPHARVELLREGVSPDADDQPRRFDIESHNALMKTAAFWRKIRAPMALLVQDDGSLFRRGGQPSSCLDDDAEVMAQHYVGAPWLEHPANRGMLEGAGVGPGLVGNGGLSLRRVSTMIEVCESDSAAFGATLFNSNTQPVPEDVFFAAAVERRGLSCPRSVAARFAFEEQMSGASTYGLHKPWPYVARGALIDALEAIITVG